MLAEPDGKNAVALGKEGDLSWASWSSDGKHLACLTRKGILSLSPTLVYVFWHSGEPADSSDLQMTFTPASYAEGVQGQGDAVNRAVYKYFHKVFRCYGLTPREQSGPGAVGPLCSVGAGTVRSQNDPVAGML